MHHFMMLQDKGFAWDDSERGCFWTDFFPPVDFPVVPHTPWVQHNIPIPPSLYEDMCTIVQKKINAGVYERSNLSYCSCWFCVAKKTEKLFDPFIASNHSMKSPFSIQASSSFPNTSQNNSAVALVVVCWTCTLDMMSD